MSVPWMCDAVVIAQDGDNYRLMVGLTGGLGFQVPAISVAVATHGPRDGVRGDFPPLPAVGTHGRVSFSRGDIRNGRWEGSHEPSLIDAFPHSAGNPNVRYTADFSGHWAWHGADGTTAQSWPDGTSLLLGLAMPSPTRHTLGPNQVRTATVFTAAQRNPNPPGAFPFLFAHGSGVRIAVSASGAVAVSGVAGQPITLVDADGGSITQLAGTTTVSGALHVTGPVIGGYGTGDQVGLLSHGHPQGSDSHGDSEQNTGPPIPGT